MVHLDRLPLMIAIDYAEQLLLPIILLDQQRTNVRKQRTCRLRNLTIDLGQLEGFSHQVPQLVNGRQTLVHLLKLVDIAPGLVQIEMERIACGKHRKEEDGQAAEAQCLIAQC